MNVWHLAWIVPLIVFLSFVGTLLLLIRDMDRFFERIENLRKQQ